MVEVRNKKVKNDMKVELDSVFLIQTNFNIYLQSDNGEGFWLILSNHKEMTKEIDYLDARGDDEVKTVEDFYNTYMLEKEEIVKVVTERDKFNIIIEIE